MQRDVRQRAQVVVREAKRNATGRSVATANNPEGRGPRIRTGLLYDSIDYERGEDAQGIFYIVFSHAPYSIYLEDGLRNGNTYPFLYPALLEAGEL